ncbi:hypothetical protein SteCoe_37275 [Stentor coeruleus]|uniref:Uncharacterized protein n=1 Tax=Stentor coeruleus TaxID=5963 RepID=A0A1R2ANG4_9CILI|nr:hypothetical protein SteCoe_37275 [Stentor coeruleus]
MENKLVCPEIPTSRNLIDIGDLLNSKEGSEIQEFAFKYTLLRDKVFESSDSSESIYDLIQEYVKTRPYTTRRKDKKKSKMQYLFEENHIQHQRSIHGPEHPVSIRDAKHPWNMNPGRLYIPKHVADRLREIQLGKTN